MLSNKILGMSNADLDLRYGAMGPKCLICFNFYEEIKYSEE